jgi:very-short-patch-repair endonuclease/predicted transcriptional regulator of viral defense system
MRGGILGGMAEAPYVPELSVPFREEPPRDVRIATLADRQHGVVSVAQLRKLGLEGRAVRQRSARGGLHRVHRGVYAVGRRGLTANGVFMAAVLACGPDATLSHRSAACHRGLRPDNRATVDVSVPRPSGRSRETIKLHLTGTLAPQDVTVCDGIPCTSVARTLVDLGDVAPPRAVERAVERAEAARAFDAKAVDEVLTRVGPRRGAGVLRRVLGDLEDNGAVANDFEGTFLAICRAAALPEPAVNAWLVLGDGPIRADFLWRENRLIVETDGRATHATRQAFESDRLRDQRATVAGYRVVRFTWRQLNREPEHVASTVAALLGR